MTCMLHRPERYHLHHRGDPAIIVVVALAEKTIRCISESGLSNYCPTTATTILQFVYNSRMQKAE